MTFTTSDAAAVLNAGRGTAYPAWTPFVALFTASPTDAGSLAAELTGGGYARQAITFGVPATKGTNNTGALTFSATIGTAITFIGICDAASAGTVRRYAPVTGGTVTVGSSGTVTVAVAAITDTFT